MESFLKEKRKTKEEKYNWNTWNETSVKWNSLGRIKIRMDEKFENEEEKIERTLEMREDVHTCELERIMEMFERSANETHHLLVLTLKDCIIGWPS